MRRYWSKRRNKQRWFTLCESAYCCPCIVNEQADYFCVLAERDEIQVILHFLLMQQSCRVPFHHCHSQTHVFEHITGYRCHRSHNVLLSGTRPIDRPSTWPGSFTVSQLHYISVNFSDHFSSHPNYSLSPHYLKLNQKQNDLQSPILTGSIGVKAIHFSASFFLFNEVPENPTPLAPLYMTWKHTIFGIMRSLHLLLEFQGILMVSALVLSSSPVRLLSNTRTPNHL